MSVSGVSSPNKTAYGTTDPSATAPTTALPKTLGVDDFMKLLATQFQQQDPMKPMDDTAFIAQTAQFTGLQQTSTLVQQMTQLNAAMTRASANSYVGTLVTVDAGQGQTVVGQVTAVDSSGDTPQVIINGQPYDVSQVLRVELPPVSATTTTPPSPTDGA
jgi:flagellar basal-body rod modification protein FlgD